MREGVALIAFTERGFALAEALAADLVGTVSRGGEISLAAWTAEHFPGNEALVFVGAVGIAVRGIAPHIRSKAADPAIVCVDEAGRWVVPILSGHLGGANALAERIAELTGGEAVITTATDLNGLFAVDLWAKKQDMVVLMPERIKLVSSKILRGEELAIDCPRPISGELPAHVRLGSPADVLVSYRAARTDALQLVPRVLTLGIGCKRGTSETALEAAFASFCAERDILPQAIAQAASITLKEHEAGLLAFCKANGWPVQFYSADELRAVAGDFSASAFVESTVGVDNVCERAAVLASNGHLIEKKYAHAGVTFALAEKPAQLDWRW